MAFEVPFTARAPDAGKSTHRSTIDTGMYQLHSVVAQTQDEARDVCREFLEREDIDSAVLCPGFTHSDGAEIAGFAQDTVAIWVVRGDGPSSRGGRQASRREGYFPKRAAD